jgi:hypothetical protein
MTTYLFIAGSSSPLRDDRRWATSGDVWRAQAGEHRVVADVGGREVSLEQLSGGCDQEVDGAEAVMAASVAPAKFTAATADGFIHWHPTQGAEQAVGACTFR